VGELIHLSERMADRSRPASAPARFFFALDDPISYLAAERIERALGPIEWEPALGPLSEPDGPVTVADRDRRARERMLLAERHARTLGLPLVEPHPFPLNSRKASRAAAFAVDSGAGAAFALAVARLAFCGGFDIARDSVIEEAAAGAGLDPAEAVTAAGDPHYDLRLDATSRGLRSRGVSSPPAISIGVNWFDGPDAVIAAASFSARRARLGTPPTAG